MGNPAIKLNQSWYTTTDVLAVLGSNAALTVSSEAIDRAVDISGVNIGLDPKSIWTKNVTTLDQDENGSKWEFGSIIYSNNTSSLMQPSGLIIK